MTIKNNSLAGFGAIVATVVTLAAATPLRAETVSQPVSYSDLDLSTDAGVATLKSRVSRAADRICGRTGNVPTVASARCRAKAIEGAKADMAMAVAKSDLRFAAR
ncbi:UrcA family protein [Edaphosphingomonas haloaromaticamans]|uniref:UrcA family protein n=1 Tax=Edaphosphingomonas haloaromaticamans TaxID=653954 RepID=A0A1S1HDS1_9SPHN|nr:MULTISPECIES: UrcA family protein [Sphingomonas]MDX3885351.1 UrcA family protein [Sphingomonas sp.]OHT18640.1 hypothetical protein BHE75_00614 [Sphingomonas haloaromaticamans]